jgi:hypothetical protein
MIEVWFNGHTSPEIHLELDYVAENFGSGVLLSNRHSRGEKSYWCAPEYQKP